MAYTKGRYSFNESSLEAISIIQTLRNSFSSITIKTIQPYLYSCDSVVTNEELCTDCGTYSCFNGGTCQNNTCQCSEGFGGGFCQYGEENNMNIGIVLLRLKHGVCLYIDCADIATSNEGMCQQRSAPSAQLYMSVVCRSEMMWLL